MGNYQNTSRPHRAFFGMLVDSVTEGVDKAIACRECTLIWPRQASSFQSNCPSIIPYLEKGSKRRITSLNNYWPTLCTIVLPSSNRRLQMTAPPHRIQRKTRQMHVLNTFEHFELSSPGQDDKMMEHHDLHIRLTHPSHFSLLIPRYGKVAKPTFGFQINIR